VTELFRHATDDQLALAFCFGGVFVSGMIMYFSFHVGQFTQKSRLGETLPQAKPQIAAEPIRRRDAA
jgi:hypothetical protein